VACIALIRKVYSMSNIISVESVKVYANISVRNLVISAIICDIYVFAKDLNNHIRHFFIITAR
jgi:hypothetical protein